MATRVAFFLGLSLYLSGSRIPGRLELFNPDAEVTSSGKRVRADAIVGRLRSAERRRRGARAVRA